MVVLKCPECNSINLTLDTKYDVKCLDCGYESCEDNFKLDEINDLGIVENLNIQPRKVIYVKGKLTKASRANNVIYGED